MGVVRPIIKNHFMLAALGCLTCSTAVLADRDVGPQQYHYFQSLRKKRSKNQYSTSKLSQGNDDPFAAKYSVRSKNEARDAVLYNSFMLAVIFWTVRFLGPPITRWVCKDILDFTRFISCAKEKRRRDKKKTHRKQGMSAGNETTSISPSVMEILDMGDITDDDASVVSSLSTFSSVTTFLRSVLTSPRRRSKTTSAAVAPDGFGSSSHSNRRLKHKSSNARPSKNPKRHTYKDEEGGNLQNSLRNSLPTFLRFIDEDNVNTGAVDEKLRKDSRQHRNMNSLDDASHIPTTGELVKQQMNHGYNPKSKRKSSSRLEKKLTAGAETSDGHSNHKHTQQEKHTSSRSHHHRGHHRHRDRKHKQDRA